MRKARYVRISTKTQNPERQLKKRYPSELIFVDIISGVVKFTERPKGKELIQLIGESQINYLSISSIDRLGRNTIDILNTIELLNSNNVILKVDNLGIESLINGKPNFAFKLIVSVLSNVSEMERESLLERQREGIEIAKLEGKYKGRVKGTKECPKQFLSRHKKTLKMLDKKHSLRDVAKLCDVSLSTVQKVKKLRGTIN